MCDEHGTLISRHHHVFNEHLKARTDTLHKYDAAFAVRRGLVLATVHPGDELRVVFQFFGFFIFPITEVALSKL